MIEFVLYQDKYIKDLDCDGIFKTNLLESSELSIQKSLFTSNSNYFYNQSMKLLLKEQINKAYDYIMKALTLEPTKIIYTLKLVYILTLLGRYEEALYQLERIDIRNCTEVEKKLRLFKFSLLYFRKEQFEKALLYNDRYWLYFDKHVATYQLRGSIFNGLKRYNEAIELFLEATKMSPDYYATYVVLARCYDYLKDYENSIYYYKLALLRKFIDKTFDRRTIELKLKNVQEKTSQKKFV
jgi:tetratricopeptide (TPR) repeat protein